MKSMTYNQLKRLVMEASKINVDDVDMVAVDNEKQLNALLDTLKENGEDIKEVAKLREALDTITLDALEQRADAKRAASVARQMDKETKGLDDAAKAYADMAGDFTRGKQYYFSVAGHSKRTGILLERVLKNASQGSQFTALMERLNDEEILSKYPKLRDMGAGMLTMLRGAMATLKDLGVADIEGETTWRASLYDLDAKDKFSRVSEGLGTWISDKFKAFKNWFMGKFFPRYQNRCNEFEEDLQEYDQMLNDIDEICYDFQGQSAMLQENRRARFGRRFSSR